MTPDGQTTRVGAIMSRDVQSLREQDTVQSALQLMHDFDIRHVPVVRSDGVLVGLVSDRDLREYTVPTLVRVRDPAQHEALLSTPLDEVMRVGVVCVEPEESVRQAIDIMLDYRVGALPVVSQDSRTLCGIISYVDILKLVSELFTR